MQIVRLLEPTGPRLATPEDVADLELQGSWVVDVRREPRATERVGWLVDWEDDIVFLTDEPAEPADAAEAAEEPRWPLDAA